MESLLCDENWLRSPATDYPCVHQERSSESCIGSFYTTREDSENALVVCLEKEISYMPEAGYMGLLQSSDLMAARFIAVRLFIKSLRRLDLSLGTVFNAANYFDRFVSKEYCEKWKYWMIELLSVACLSIAVKFSEVSIPPLHELQVWELEHSFQPSTIQRMELTVLEALGWRLNCITAYSYVDLLTWHLDALQPCLHGALTSRLTELLLGALSDPKFLEFRPCTVAVSALRCSLEEIFPSQAEKQLTNIGNLIPEDLQDDIDKCHKIMEERVADPLYSLMACPSSPVTVMTKQRMDMHNCCFDLCLFKISGSNISSQSNPKKRKKEEDYKIPTKSSVTFLDPSSRCM